MRLTLRTLLAYMDDILELEDAQDIAKKVQESERASQLLHRIRDVTQRLGLAAPDVSERGDDLDPNTVAEYLDNTLPADRVVDFEKVCLDSDIHLSEVASCHQILTLVLGEPAEVEPESRQRMYQIPTLPRTAEEAAELPAQEHREAESPQLAENTAISARREKPSVPEYLREPRQKRHWLTVALVATTAACSVVGTLWATGQLERDAPLGAWLAGVPLPEISEKRETPENRSPSSSQTPAATPSMNKAMAVGPIVQQPPGVATTTGPADKITPAAPAAPLPPDADPVAPPAPSPSTAQLPADGLPASGLTPATRPIAQGPATKTVENVAVAPPSPSARPPHLEEPVAKTAPTTPTQPPVANAAAALSPASPTPPGAAEGQSPPLPTEPVADYISTTEVLVRLNPQTNIWQRVPARARVNAQDQVLSFPTYRPLMTVAGCGDLLLLDGTRVMLLGADAEGTAGILVQYGRLVLKAKQQNARIRIQIGDRTSTIQFGDSGSELKLEVRYPVDASVDPETKPGEPVADCYVTSGKVLWQGGPGQEPLSIAAPAKFQWQEIPSPPVAFEKPPVWGPSETVDSWDQRLDQRASPTVERLLGMDRSVALSLRELADRPQREVRWLALRCLAHVGDFELMANALNDPQQKPFWQDYIDEMRAALARGPESAAAVRETMVKLYRTDGTGLYDLLWKYRKPKLQPQEATQLIDLLDREPLAMRVLSFCNLREATGFLMFYRPEHPASKRQLGVEKWRDWLRASTPSAPGASRSEIPRSGKPPASPAPAKSTTPGPP